MTDTMVPSITLVVTASVLFGCGVYLLLARSVIRALIGFLLLSNGVNLLFIVASGSPGDPPVLGDEQHHGVYTDPVPQALVLTAIVITLGMTAFVLALAHRSWQLTRSDLVDDDPESARIHLLAEASHLDDPGSEAEADATIAAGADETQDSEEAEDSEIPVAIRRAAKPKHRPRESGASIGEQSAAARGDHATHGGDHATHGGEDGDQRDGRGETSTDGGER